MNIKETLIGRYSEPGSNSITLEAVVPDMTMGLAALLLIDSLYIIFSGKFIAFITGEFTILGFLHAILSLIVVVFTFIFLIIEGPEIFSDIWYEIKNWEIFTFKEK